MFRSVGTFYNKLERKAKPIIASLGCTPAFCIHPSVHADTFCDTVIAVADRY